MPRLSIIPLLVFITLASMILLIACFNLTNTTIALTVKRLKEIGVRKTVGARRSQIITQFLLEIVITITIAILVGMGLSQIIVPEFTAMWGLEYGLEDLSTANLLAALVILIFVSALLAGAYPALNNSKFKPVSLLKGQSKVKGTNALTKLSPFLGVIPSVVHSLRCNPKRHRSHFELFDLKGRADKSLPAIVPTVRLEASE